MDTPNRFPNGGQEIVVRVAVLYDGESYIVFDVKGRGKNASNQYIDMNRSQALQLAKAIELIAASLPSKE